MTFLRPDLAWVLVAALVAMGLVRVVRRKRALAFTRVRLLALRAYRASRVRHLPTLLVTAALLLALLALLEPVVPLGEQQVEARGLDIVLAIDLSLSMYERIGAKPRPGVMPEQAPPGSARIDAIKEALRDFIARRRDDRIALVVFSDNAYVVSPLTFDREHLFGYFDLIDPNTLYGEGMTGIGEGIARALELIGRQSRGGIRNKVIVVFTDGASNVGRDPAEALEDAAAHGVRVHVVGVDLQEEQKRSPQVLRLVSAVQERGGRYYAADSRAELSAASRSLDEIEKGFLTTKIYVRNRPVVQWFALPAVVLLAVAMGLRAIPVLIGLH